MPAAKNDPHGLGSAITYARRYSLMSMLCLATEDDDGNAATGNRDAFKGFDEPKPTFKNMPTPAKPMTAQEFASKPFVSANFKKKNDDHSH